MQNTFDIHAQAMVNIDRFRESLRGKKIDVKKLITQNKRELADRTLRILNSHKFRISCHSERSEESLDDGLLS